MLMAFHEPQEHTPDNLCFLGGRKRNKINPSKCIRSEPIPVPGGSVAVSGSFLCWARPLLVPAGSGAVRATSCWAGAWPGVGAENPPFFWPGSPRPGLIRTPENRAASPQQLWEISAWMEFKAPRFGTFVQFDFQLQAGIFPSKLDVKFTPNPTRESRLI